MPAVQLHNKQATISTGVLEANLKRTTLELTLDFLSFPHLNINPTVLSAFGEKMGSLPTVLD